MHNVVMILFPIWLVAISGYLAGRYSILPLNADEVLSKYVFYYAMPVLLFSSLASSDIAASFNFKLVTSFALSTLICAVFTVAVARKHLQIQKSNVPFFIMGTSYVNSINLGLPLSLIAFGDALPVVIINIFQLLIVSPILIAMMEQQAENKPIKCVLKNTGVSLLKHPIIIATMLGLTFSVFDFQPSKIMGSTFQLISQSAVPLALFSLGLTLSKINIQQINMFKGDVRAAILIKLFIQPLVAWLVGYYIIGLEDEFLFPLVLIAGLPSPQNVVVFSQKYKMYVHQSTVIVFFTSTVSVFSIPFILYLTTNVY